MKKSFNYFQNTNIIFGRGSINGLGDLIKQYGRKCLLVTTPSVDPLSELYEKVKKIIIKEDVEVFHFDNVIPNPTTHIISEGARVARENAVDLIIGLGGGSSLDAAKAIAVESTHKGSAWDYLFYKKQPGPETLPIIAISTTSGTGSHVTQVSVITNPEKRDKSALYNPILFPKACIIDPELMLSLPNHVSSPTGFDVLCHAFESTLNPGTGIYTELLASEAIKIVVSFLPRILKDPLNIEYREKLAWADTLAGLCIANSGVTLPHGMGMAIGGMYPHIAHGEALAMVYPACSKFTWSFAIEQYAILSKILNPELDDLPDKSAAKEAYNEINKFLKAIKLNCNLKSSNVPEDELDKLAVQCMVLPDYKSNPRLANLNQMKEILREAYC